MMIHFMTRKERARHRAAYSPSFAPYIAHCGKPCGTEGNAIYYSSEFRLLNVERFLARDGDKLCVCCLNLVKP